MAAATASFPTPDSACSDGASWRYGSDGSSSSLLQDSAADDTSGECEHAERTELGDGSDLLGTLPAPIKEGAGMKADRGYVDGSMESDAILDSVNEMVAELGGEGLTMLEAQLLVAEVLDGEESESSVDGIAPEESAVGALGDEWYFVDDMDAVQGPIDWSALKDAVSNGNVQSQTWVFRSGMPDWIAADDVPDLVDLPLSSSPIPPPPPTTSPPKKEAIARNLVQDENYSANALPSHGAAGLKISTGSEDSCAGTDKFDLISPLVSKRRRTRGKSSIQHRTHRFSARFELEDLTEGEQESRKSPTSNQNPPAPVDEPADRTMTRNIADASMHKRVEVEANTEHSVDESRMTASQLLDAIAGFDKERRLKKVKRQSRIFGAKRRSVSRASLGSVPPLPLPGEKESTIASLLAHAIMRRRSEMNYDEEDF